jgi:hypothetical protein
VLETYLNCTNLLAHRHCLQGLRCVPYVNKFWTLTASIAVALCAGVTYSFPIWSSVLKDTYALSQEQLQLIASTANVGGYSSIISGLVYDLLAKHKKVGPRVVLLIGSIANAAGYLGLWAAIQGLFQAQLWHLAALAALAANGGTWSDTTAMATNVSWACDLACTFFVSRWPQLWD